jgi:hypothetical protein
MRVSTCVRLCVCVCVCASHAVLSSHRMICLLTYPAKPSKELLFPCGKASIRMRAWITHTDSQRTFYFFTRKYIHTNNRKKIKPQPPPKKKEKVKQPGLTEVGGDSKRRPFLLLPLAAKDSRLLRTSRSRSVLSFWRRASCMCACYIHTYIYMLTCNHAHTTSHQSAAWSSTSMYIHS